MRAEFYEKRRRKKMRVLVDFINENRHKYVPQQAKKGKSNITAIVSNNNRFLVNS